MDKRSRTKGHADRYAGSSKVVRHAVSIINNTDCVYGLLVLHRDGAFLYIPLLKSPVLVFRPTRLRAHILDSPTFCTAPTPLSIDLAIHRYTPDMPFSHS